MVLGCYYLTATNPKTQLGEGRYFANLEDVLKAYDQGQLSLHAAIWVRHKEADVVTEKPDNEVIKTETLEDGSVVTHYRMRKIRKAPDGKATQFVKTTVGRIIYNKSIQEALTF